MLPRRLFLVSALALLVASCASVRTNFMPGSSAKLTGFQRAYIQAPHEDEFQMASAIAWELSDMGMQVVAEPISNPTERDLLVTFNYDAGWDFSRYLKAFQIQYTDARSKRIIATSTYRASGIWRGVRDGRLEDAFNSLRAQNGLPPTTQFSR